MDNRRLDRDLLSDLPVGIIEIILMQLPIRDAIRTSILSTKWRYRWTHLPQLDFEEEHMVSEETRDANHEKHLKNFVNRTLFLHQGLIQKFQLFVRYMDSCPATDQWLLFLSRKHIEELIIAIDECEAGYFHLPSRLYSCSNLTSLDLWGCQFDLPPPTFKGFLYLRSLILQRVKVSSDAIESIVARSPLLENVECAYSGDSELRISAPNLKRLCLVGTFQEIHLCAPLLAKMEIRLEDDDFEAEQIEPKHSVCNYTKLLGGFTNLESLTGAAYFTKYLSTGIEYCHPLVFHHLKVIELYRVNFEDVDEILAVVRLIMDAATSLRELRVSVTIDHFEVDALKDPRIHSWNFKGLRNCTFKKLKVINMIQFHGSPQEKNFIQKLLESSPVLETMIIDPTPSLTSRQETLNSIVAELLSYSRASTNANIMVKQR